MYFNFNFFEKPSISKSKNNIEEINALLLLTINKGAYREKVKAKMFKLRNEKFNLFKIKRRTKTKLKAGLSPLGTQIYLN